MNTLRRIKQFIDYKGLTNQKFEIEIGFSNGAFASQLKNNKTIGVDKLENILIKFPEIDANWLLTGQGSMLKSGIVPVVAVVPEDAGKIAQLEQVNAMQAQLIEVQKQSLQDKNKIIATLEREANQDKRGFSPIVGQGVAKTGFVESK